MSLSKEINSKGVLVAMSGGVDSSAAAAVLVDAGFDVIGASMNLLTCNRLSENSCCSAADRRDARLVCQKLGIPYHVFDCRKRFRQDVIAPFVEEYVRGRTPSPCILCNEFLKFRVLFEEADRLGAKYIATGHYARIRREGDLFKLLRGVDANKDQSYFLFSFRRVDLPTLGRPINAM